MEKEKLKTLKDVPSSLNEDDYTDHSKYYQDKQLKQEAIKRAKHFQFKLREEKNNIHKLYWKGRLIEIMDFADLKEGDFILWKN